MKKTAISNPFRHLIFPVGMTLLGCVLLWSMLSLPHALGHHHGFSPFVLGRILLTIVCLVILGRYTYSGRFRSSQLEDPSTRANVLPQDENIAAAVHELTNHLDIQQPYLDESLTLAALSAQLGWSLHQLSRVINQGMNMSYAELINQRRVDWAKQQLADKQQRNTKIMAIGWNAGFTSKTAFYRAFKKHTGLTPAAFRDRARVKENGAGS